MITNIIAWFYQIKNNFFKFITMIPRSLYDTTWNGTDIQ